MYIFCRYIDKCDEITVGNSTDKILLIIIYHLSFVIMTMWKDLKAKTIHILFFLEDELITSVKMGLANFKDKILDTYSCWIWNVHR